MLEIRSYQPTDREAVVALWGHCGLLRPANDPFKDIDRKQKVRGDLFLVGTEDGQVVASVMVGYEGHRGWLNYLAVDPGRRQRGYGRQMVREAERRLAEDERPALERAQQIRDDAAVPRPVRIADWGHRNQQAVDQFDALAVADDARLGHAMKFVDGERA